MKLWIIILVLVIIFLIPLCVVLFIETKLYKSLYNTLIGKINTIVKYISVSTINYEKLDKIGYTDLLECVLEDEIVLKDKNEEIERLKKMIEFINAPGTVLLNKIEKNSEIKL